MIRRSRKLVRPSLQLRISVAFLVTAAVAVLVQAGALTWALFQLAETVPNDGVAVRESVPAILRTTLLASCAVLVPSMLAIGVLATFRLAGPIDRLETHLSALATGQRPGPLRLRAGDELQDLCELVNEATAPLHSPRIEPPRVVSLQRQPAA